MNKIMLALLAVLIGFSGNTQAKSITIDDVEYTIPDSFQVHSVGAKLTQWKDSDGVDQQFPKPVIIKGFTFDQTHEVNGEIEHDVFKTVGTVEDESDFWIQVESTITETSSIRSFLGIKRETYTSDHLYTSLQYALTPVPVPPSILLLGSALLGFGLLSKRKKPQAA